MIVRQCLIKGCQRDPSPIGFCDHHLKLRKAAKSRPIRRDGPSRHFHDSEFLYVIEMAEIGAIKIGRSMDPVLRMFELQVPIPLDLHLVTAFCVASDSALRLETLMHRAMTAKGYHMRGEWFRVDRDEAVDTVRTVAMEHGIAVMALKDALEAARQIEVGINEDSRIKFDAKLQKIIRACVFP